MAGRRVGGESNRNQRRTQPRRRFTVAAIVSASVLCATVAGGQPETETGDRRRRASQARDPDRKGPPAALGELERRIESMARRARDTPSAQPPVSHARRAFERARLLHGRGRTAAAERARRIALAALELSQRRVAVEQERRALGRARRRLRHAERRAAEARSALESTLEQRARRLSEDAQGAEKAARDEEDDAP